MPRPPRPALAAALAAAAVLAAPAAGQTRDPILSSVAVGLQVGAPGGLTLRTPARAVRGWTGTVGLFGEGGVTVAVHRYRQFPLTGSPLHLFAAPGVFLGERKDDLAVGVRAELGAGFYAERFEIYLQVAPGLRLVPDADLLVQPAVGVRYAL